MLSEDLTLPEVEQHTIGQSIGLHLLPGILTGAFYYVVAQPIRNLGYPSLAAMILAIIVILIPFELGFLLYQGKKKNGTLSLEGIVLYRQRIPLRQYLLWVPVIIVLMGLIFTALTPVSNYFETFFSWMPKALRFDMGLGGEFSKAVLINSYLLGFNFLSLDWTHGRRTLFSRISLATDAAAERVVANPAQRAFCTLSHLVTLDGNHQDNRVAPVNLCCTAQKEYQFRNHFSYLS